MQEKIKCDWCGKEILRWPSKIRKHNFCCKDCMAKFSNKRTNPDGYKYRDFTKNGERLRAINAELNPSRMTVETRNKLRAARLGTGEGKSYTKIYGRHEHRLVAELKLGRPLKPGEVVHHIDGDKRNNDPNNLMVFASQAEHAAWHASHDKDWGR